MTLAQRLAEFAASLRDDAIPNDVAASVRLRLLDLLGVALAASRDSAARPILAALEGWESGGRCSVVGAGRTAAAPLAALANGALAHVLDFDDTHAGSITHASAVVLPAVLAAAEAAGADGRAATRAAVAGYETITRLGMAAPGAFHARGWHATSACGSLAAALAAGVAGGLDAARLTAALGVAGSFASGLLAFLADGSDVKRVHPGWAAHGGVVASTLASSGFTGPATVLEGRFGLYRAFLGRSPDMAPFETLGRVWETLRIGYKPYPCCHYNHAFLDLALDVRSQGIRAADIMQLECVVPAGEVPIVCEPRESKRRPRTSYDAKFSLPFSVASALVHGAVTLETYDAAHLDDRDVLDLAARITHVADLGSRFPEVFPGRLRIHLKGGRRLDVARASARGGPDSPLADEAIVEKFRANAGRALPPERVRALERAALTLDRAKNIADVLVLARQGPGARMNL